MTEPRDRSRREDLPFRRIALVLSGGGALGAYEVGVLKVLEAAGIRPAILAGVSVGAINAVLWLAHGFRTLPLERVWSRLRASTVGMRWVTLLVRGLGAFLMTLAAVQVVLTLAGSPELNPLRLVLRRRAERGESAAALLDVLAWLGVGVAGYVVVRGSRSAEAWLARLSPAREPRALYRALGGALIVGAIVHVVTWGLAIPWPHRFSASVLLVGTFIWTVNRLGQGGERARRVFLRLLPETGGRGVWGSAARRGLIRRIVASGDPRALVDPGTHLIISACDIESGHMANFVNWPEPDDGFRERIRQSVGDVVPLARPEDVIEAAVASSAIPGVFEPVRVGGREYVDGGVFSNQPLHAVLADGADAIVVVLVSLSSGLPRPSHAPNLLELAGRLLEIANWRDLQAELRALPHGWSRAQPDALRRGAAHPPLRVCVVEPESVLPGGLYGFSPSHAAELKRRGEHDAWQALEAAGWVARPPAPHEPAPARAHGGRAHP